MGLPGGQNQPRPLGQRHGGEQRTQIGAPDRPQSRAFYGLGEPLSLLEPRGLGREQGAEPHVSVYRGTGVGVPQLSFGQRIVGNIEFVYGETISVRTGPADFCLAVPGPAPGIQTTPIPFVDFDVMSRPRPEWMRGRHGQGALDGGEHPELSCRYPLLDEPRRQRRNPETLQANDGKIDPALKRGNERSMTLVVAPASVEPLIGDGAEIEIMVGRTAPLAQGLRAHGA
ncbi:hypothetical protein CMI37_07585 [Candidatus Pacearchaeota archaeon]|nr:hypothetical protein [Candidatus Pacearchaeota archaeon]